MSRQEAENSGNVFAATLCGGIFRLGQKVIEGFVGRNAIPTGFRGLPLTHPPVLSGVTS